MAFTIPEGSFELIVIFFVLTNSFAIFQTMINKILRNFINTGKMVSFIDNVVVGMKAKEGYDEIVEKVVKRLVENDLYVKLEKYK